MQKLFTLFLPILLLGLIGSCAGSKEVQNQLVGTPYWVINQQLQSQYAEFDYLKLKASFDFNSPQISQKFKGHMRFRQDSLIWLSVTPLMGMEVARALATPDSAFLLNRLQKQFCKYPLSIAKEEFGLPVSIKDVNDLFFARYDIPEQANIVKDSLDDMFWVYYGKQNYQYSVQISAADIYIKQAIVLDTVSQAYINVQYEGKLNLDSLHYIPETISFVFENEATKGKMGLKFSSIDTAGPFSFGINASKNYASCP